MPILMTHCLICCHRVIKSKSSFPFNFHFFSIFVSGTRISFGIYLTLTASIFSLVTSQDFQGYNFAAEAESLLIEPLVKEFSCEGRDYGYFADVANNCQGIQNIIRFEINSLLTTFKLRRSEIQTSTNLSSNGSNLDRSTVL